MKYWLMKSEPDVFSIDDLKSKKKTSWDGVRNYQARNFMRDDMKKDHLVLYYHSNCDVPGVYGIGKVIKESHPDHTQFDPKSDYYDPKATKEKPRWFMVEVGFVEKFKTPVSLAEIKEVKALEDMLILRKGNRLSITPVENKHFEKVTKLGNS
ncbi:MAG: EVE domain-containing protein [Bdellovibrionales bacterium CG12_big_fil_rev_8_21_14_0_65_38_15]|nr:MAG: EVE domain-containing protein [Bdellovibrionales bacterium CG22_combo_CG10-13_8_21_14_all_38_13]PIQ53408.1 MAG: EVE domain-containing protein [Bdellovibrionales bacterium CG12_big_fil_rev_8_21_14_0_65_38_15]PIR30229.1 MAG: EVE domain-containing protein [Bdellovibrionales bacterium CG11_big_fil_rev_8_21_14_0_20_38_13]